MVHFVFFLPSGQTPISSFYSRIIIPPISMPEEKMKKKKIHRIPTASVLGGNLDLGLDIDNSKIPKIFP